MDNDLRKNLLDCESNIPAKINTNHFPVILKVKMALETNEKEEATKKYHKPDAEKWEKYNTELNNRMREIEDKNNFEEILKAIKQAAENNLKEVDKERKKDYMTENTWEKYKEETK